MPMGINPVSLQKTQEGAEGGKGPKSDRRGQLEPLLKAIFYP
jgi:hypothetical protein